LTAQVDSHRLATLGVAELGHSEFCRFVEKGALHWKARIAGFKGAFARSTRYRSNGD
jgi:hypothetical protein